MHGITSPPAHDNPGMQPIAMTEVYLSAYRLMAVKEITLALLRSHLRSRLRARQGRRADLTA